MAAGDAHKCSALVELVSVLPEMSAGLHSPAVACYTAAAVCFAALLATETKLERSLTPDDLSTAQQQLHNIANNHPQRSTAEQLLQSVISGAAEFAPVCAVLGGVIANNVVMAVSASGTPLNNMLYYTLFDGRAIVETQPAAAATGTGAGIKAAAVQQQQQQEEQIELD